MMQDFFLGHWTWFILGAVLMGLELLAPGTVFLWFGFAALATGILAFLIDLGWQAEFLAFAAFALLSLAAWWRWFRKAAEESDEPLLNQRTQRLVGRRFVLETPIAAGEGRIRVLDTVWRVRGPDLPQGAAVIVEKADGPVLVVRAETD